MCGLIGLFNAGTAHRADLDRAQELLRHRGPDDTGAFRDPNGSVDLRFVRLSIIDLAGGHQPIANADQSVVALLNGEIYNYRELRQELVRDGARLSTEGDAEVLVHHFERHGPAMVDKLEGMFAILLWDQRRSTLHAFRDRFGIKPLYLARSGSQVALASEIRPLLSLPFVSRDVSDSAVDQYLAHGYTYGAETIYRNVSKVPPGTRLEISRAGIREIRYWDLADRPVELSGSGAPKDSAPWVARLLDRIDQAVHLHLRADVKVGAFLSGGYDSGILVARAAGQINRLSTYTIRFTDSLNDESAVAQEVAHRYGTAHQTIELRMEELLDLLPKAVHACDEPLADSGILPNLAISRIASQDGCKVVLSGAGGDELFAGYPYHVRSPLEARLRGLEAPTRTAGAVATLLGARELGRKLRRTGSFDSDPAFHYIGHTSVFDIPAGSASKARWLLAYPGDSQTARLYADLKTYIPDDLMFLLDRATMAYSIEGRVPFLHHPLVQDALAVPAALRTPAGERKGLLRRIAEPHLPRAVFERPKQGFNSPVDRWMRQGLRDQAFRILATPAALSRPWRARLPSRPEALQRLGFHQLWTLLQLELFALQHLDAPVGAPELPGLKELSG